MCCIVRFCERAFKRIKNIKSPPGAHLFDRLIESNALHSVEGYLFKLQPQAFCCIVQTLPLSEKIHLYVMVQFYS